MFIVKFYAYCGMAWEIKRYEEEVEARRSIAEHLKGKRQRYKTTTLRSGEEWEICEPDDCGLIPDECGTLRLLHVAYECNECGYRHETIQDARDCCNEWDEAA